MSSSGQAPFTTGKCLVADSSVHCELNIVHGYGMHFLLEEAFLKMQFPFCFCFLLFAFGCILHKRSSVNCPPTLQVPELHSGPYPASGPTVGCGAGEQEHPWKVSCLELPQEQLELLP